MPISAVCSEFGTLYILSKSDCSRNQLVYCDCEINDGNQIFLDIDEHEPVALFGGCNHFAAICGEGEIIFNNRFSVKNSPESKFKASSLPNGDKASSVAC